MHQLLLGDNDFYDEVFRAMRIPYDPVRWAPDVSLDHEDPRVVYLSRRTGGRFVVERWRTHDGGATWQHRALSHPPGDAIRPISPRNRADELEVLWMQGTYDGFFEYHTNVMARVP